MIQDLKLTLKKKFGYDSFRPLQSEIIRSVLQQTDTLVLMPTGGGKSLCYQFPALWFEGITIVISPLISLMKDQVDALLSNGISAEFINSSLSFKQIEQIQERLIKGVIKILYIAPERIANERFIGFLKPLPINLIAIDEAHCISMWGHDFRPDYRNLHNIRSYFPDVPIVALTATATKVVQEDIIAQLKFKDPNIFISSFNRHNLSYSVIPKQDPVCKLIALLKKYQGESVIIYCMSRRGCEELTAILKGEGLGALHYHAGLSSLNRKETQDKFIHGEISIIVATVAFGMGIDKPNIRLVVHYDLPKTMEGYYQETGRAGRDGLLSECILFYSYADKIKYDYLIEQINDIKEKRLAKMKMGQVITYCELNSCRRKYLLAYFGEEYKEDNCRGCDICITPPDESDCTVISQKILSCIIRTKERFGMNYIIDILKGADTAKIRSNSHETISTYGIVSDFNAGELKHIMLSLIAKGLLKKDGDKYPVLKVTPKGWSVLKKRETIFLVRPRKIKTKEERKGLFNEKEVDEDLFLRLRALKKKVHKKDGSTTDKTLWFLSKKTPLEEIAKIRGLAKGTIVSHIERIRKERPSIDISYLKPDEESLKKILTAFDRSGGPALAPVKEALGNSFSYDEIRLARIFWEKAFL